MGTEANSYNSLPAVSGLLAIDKSIGMTSRDCVNRIERLLRELFPKPAKLPKVGHAGTLDPLATGVLVIGIGSGVRLVPYIQQMAKQYDATFRLGCWSETGDLEGELSVEADPLHPGADEILSAASSMIGNITQTPPATSAVRVDGKQAYKYAHRGEAVVVPSRVVRIDSISITRYEYPEVDLLIQCGSGTYIRTLGMDLAEKCGTRAVMSRLRRTAIGNFVLDNCVKAESLTAESLSTHLLPLRYGVVNLPTLPLSTEQVVRVSHGIKLPVAEVVSESSDEAVLEAVVEAAVIDDEGELRVILRRESDWWCPYRVFHRLSQ